MRKDLLTAMDVKLIEGYVATDDAFGYDLYNFKNDLLAMFLIGIGLRILTFLLLKLRTK
jgi:hypothetical protein